MKKLLLGFGGCFVLIALVAAIYAMNMKPRAPWWLRSPDGRPLPLSLAMGIRDKATGEGLETGSIWKTGQQFSKTPPSINLGEWIKTIKDEQVFVSYDITSITNGQPSFIMVHYAFDKAGAKTKVDLPLQVFGADKSPKEWVWAKLDDRLETVAYLTAGGSAGY